MSFALRLPATMRAPLTLSGRTLVAPTRSFQSCRVLAAGKESALHNEGRAEEAEKLKQEHLRDQKAGKNTWTEGLASDSESIVKADRGEVKADKSTIEELQKESAKAAQQEQK